MNCDVNGIYVNCSTSFMLDTETEDFARQIYGFGTVERFWDSLTFQSPGPC